MGFWGIEVKPGKPHPYHSDNVPGRLHITQATLGLGSSSERSILQCSVGHKSPIFLCSLIPRKIECCALDLEFEENDDLVAFSVIGARSIHLSGYFVAEDDGGHLRDEYDSDQYEDDDAKMEYSDGESSDYDSEDDSESLPSEEDHDLFSCSPVRKSGVVIEEITDEDKPRDENAESKPAKKKKQSTESEEKNNSGSELIVRNGSAAPVLESEDEDGFPVSASQKSKSTTNESQARVDGQKEDMTSEDQKMKTIDSNNRKRKSKTADEDSKVEREIKNKKKKKKQKEQSAADNVEKMSDDEIDREAATVREKDQVLPARKDGQKPSRNEAPEVDANIVQNENQPEQKKKKKKKKNQEGEGGNGNEGISSNGNKKSNSLLKSEEKQATAKSSQVRTFSNGLAIEELVLGKPDGKRASRGKQVSVHYIGKLKKNGKIFDSNVGRAPFKFRLGIGQVIKGWDVGVEGMRIGDKRRLMIPPSMGYGAKVAGPIPANSWLEFEVELVDVR